MLPTIQLQTFTYSKKILNNLFCILQGFNHVFWAFTKTDMSQTLSMIIDQDEINALEVFHLILTYAGLMQTNKEENTNGQNSV